jgi:uncharacterized protein (DUF1810 family)
MSQVSTTDHFDLHRFIGAQNGIYTRVLAELRRGRKQTHWIWFIFPQIEGLGHSSMAQHFSIRSREEAIAYLAMPVLGARLIECTKLVLAVPNKSAHEIFGSPDDMKFRSSMTLFDAVDRGDFYGQALDRFYGGGRDEATLDILQERSRTRSLHKGG